MSTVEFKGKFSSSYVQLGVAAVVAVAFNLWIHWSPLSAYLDSLQNLWQGRPLLTTPDGYYYLRLATEFLEKGYNQYDGLRGMNGGPFLPPLSWLTASLSYVTAIHPESIAFYLPPFLGSLALAVPLSFGFSQKKIGFGLVAALFMSVSYNWFERTGFGSFDTDALVLGFFWMTLFACYQFCAANTGRSKLIWILCAIVFGVCLSLWWWPTGIVFALACFGLIVIEFCFAETMRATLIRFGILLGGGFGSLGLLLAYRHSLPAFLQPVVNVLYANILFAVGKNETLFGRTGQTIGELTPYTWAGAIHGTAGNWLVFAFFVVGAVLMLRQNRRLALFVVVPAVAFFVLSVCSGNRFAMFAVPGIALGAAWACCQIVEAFSKTSGKSEAGFVLVLLVGALLFVPTRQVVAKKLSPIYDRRTAILANHISLMTEKDAVLWNWWSSGYFLQYFAKRRTIIDNGSQSSEWTYVDAVPLANSDPRLSQYWIKLFSHEPRALNILAGQLGGKLKAVEFLKEIYGDPVKAPALIEKYKLKTGRNWMRWLFPESNAYIVLLSDMLYRNTWLGLGNRQPGAEKTQWDVVISLRQEGSVLERGRGAIHTDDGTMFEYSRLIVIKPGELGFDPVRAKGPVVITIEGHPNYFVVRDDNINAIAFRLMFVFPKDTPGFQLQGYNPFIGGVWKVGG